MNVNQNISLILKSLHQENTKNSSVIKSQKLSFENIRILRQHFEKISDPLRSILGEDKHQTMIVAMYEGTEKLLNKDVSEFAVLEYLEGLKLAAKELSQMGISGEEFRTNLLEHSVTKVLNLVRSS